MSWSPTRSGPATKTTVTTVTLVPGGTLERPAHVKVNLVERGAPA
ncbi:hypothetical protein [Amycolatopsis deserti]|nr:hypothetical protein [Amycolatopsis deserti]